jgi:starch-binding outer membrane protein, SusD/RagB family
LDFKLYKFDKMKTNIFNYSIILLIIILASCSESLLDEKPISIIGAESLYKDLEGFEAGLNGIYALVQKERSTSGISDGAIVDVFMVGTDIIQTSNASGFGGVAEIWGPTLSSTEGHLNEIFLWLYRINNAANTIISRAENPDIVWGGQSDVHKNRVVAEAKAIRAWAYRHLTYCWGDVPLILEESQGTTIKLDYERTQLKIIREQMRNDLLFAEKYVPVEPSLPGRMTKGAIQTYLAEVYLLLNKPDSAIIFSNKVIAGYPLISERFGVNRTRPGTPFSDMFLEGNSNREEGNTEALWVFQYDELLTASDRTNWMRRQVTTRYDNTVNGSKFMVTVERGGRGRARLALTKFAIDLYEPENNFGTNDDRGSNYILRKYLVYQNSATNSLGATSIVPADAKPDGTNFGDTLKFDWSVEFVTGSSPNRYRWPWSRKFDNTDGADLQRSYTTNDQIYLRSAEAYLIKAEAQNKQGDKTGAAATINILRARSNAAPITPGDVTIDLILDERARELVYEEHRRYSLLRNNKWLERTTLYNKNGGQFVTARDTIYPIPQSVIDANLTIPMPQNPGY